MPNPSGMRTWLYPPFVEQLAIGKPFSLFLRAPAAKPPMDCADCEVTAPPCLRALSIK
jgi:hypothetical protein